MHPRPHARLRSLVRWCSRGLSLGACGATEDVPRPKPGLIRVCQRPLRASLAGRTNASVPTWAFLVLALPSMSPVSTHPKNFLSDKVEHFTESVIREMTRQAMQYGAVNLAQGFPDFPAPAEIKRAAQEAIAADVNQYAITWGAKSLRSAIARQMREWQGIEVDPEEEIGVCGGP